MAADVTIAALKAENDRLRELVRLRRENAELKSRMGGPPITFKVSEKAAISVYGLGRFPVTLYKQQWQRLAQAMPALLKFADEHEAELATKAPEQRVRRTDGKPGVRDLEALVLGALRFDLAATAEGIAALLGLEPDRVADLLADLERRGLVAAGTEH